MNTYPKPLLGTISRSDKLTAGHTIFLEELQARIKIISSSRKEGTLIQFLYDYADDGLISQVLISSEIRRNTKGDLIDIILDMYIKEALFESTCISSDGSTSYDIRLQ